MNIITTIINRLKFQTYTIMLVKKKVETVKKDLNEAVDIVISENLKKHEEVFLQRAHVEKMNVKKYLITISKRIERGDICALLKINEDYVAFLFISFRQAFIDTVDYVLPLDSNQVAIHDVYTFPSFRGKNYYPLLFNRVNKYLADRNYSQIVLWLMPHNKRSIRSHIKIGFDVVSAIICRKEFLGVGWTSSVDSKQNLREYLNG